MAGKNEREDCKECVLVGPVLLEKYNNECE